jgi:hypothetical protein
MRINRRPWSFVAVLILILAACAGTTGVPSPPAGTGLAISALAGPTCPVETIPPDPACAPRPVAGAKVVIFDAQGGEAATVVLDAKGSAVVSLAAGKYVVRAQPAAGLMGTPEAMDATVVDGQLTPVALSYDTGIR